MKHLFKALADFQQEVPVIHKGTQGYGYSFADLPTIFNVINPLLQKHGLGFTQLVGKDEITTMLFHIESGESLTTNTSVPNNVHLKGMNEFQVMGSAITYIRRYALSAMLGIITDKDTDAGGEQLPKKKVLNNDQFTRACQAIDKGDYSIEALKKEYALTKEQLTEVDNWLNS